MLISPTKTTKTINKQLSPDENSSGEALDYNKVVTKTLWSSKLEMAAWKSIGSILPASPHSSVQGISAPGEIPSKEFVPWGKETQENSSKPHCSGHLQPLILRIHCDETCLQGPKLLLRTTLWDQDASAPWDW